MVRGSATMAEAAAFLGEELRISVPKRSANNAVDKVDGTPPGLTLTTWSQGLVRKFLFDAKLGFNKDELLCDAGLRLGKYLCKSEAGKYETHLVLAIPVWGESGSKANPVNWIVTRLDCGLLAAWEKVGDKYQFAGNQKRKTIGGNKRGLIGDVRQIDGLLSGTAPAGPSIKTEGISDWLTAFLRDDLPADAIVWTNPMGCRDQRNTWTKDRWSIDCFRDREAWVIHDCDTPGQISAIGDGNQSHGWAQYLATAGAITKNIELPLPFSDTHGQDLRDYLAGGGTFIEINRLAEIASAVDPIPPDQAAIAEVDKKTVPANLSNYIVEFVTEDNDKGEPVDKRVKTPRSIDDIAAELLSQHGGWPKSVGSTLFVHDSDRDSIEHLDSASRLFAFARRSKIVQWGNSETFVTKSEFYEGLQSCVDRFNEIERYPHFPTIESHYYTCDVPAVGDGEALETLLDHYSPGEDERDINRELIKSFIATLFWGGPPGSRPGWLITSQHGTGQGKSTLVTSLASLVGGCYEFSSDTPDEKIRTGLLTPDDACRRVAMLDNVKTGRLSSASIESLITSPTIAGHRLNHGFASRPNSLTWAVTMNGAALSRDMAERCVNIQLGRPSHSGSWEESLRTFIRVNQSRIVADVAAFFSRPTTPLARYTRWGRWEHDVLSRLSDPAGVQAAIAERSKISNADCEEADTLREYFAAKISAAVAMQNRVSVESVNLSTKKVHIPMSVVAAWSSEALGEKLSGHAAGKMIDRLHGAGGLPELVRNPCRTSGRGFLWWGSASGEDVDYLMITSHYGW